MPAGGEGDPPPKICEDPRGNLLRCLTCAMMAVLAIAVGNNVADFVALIGALFGLPVNCIFPSLIYWRMTSGQKSWTRRIPDLIVMTLTTMICVLCISVTLSNWGQGE